MKKRNLFKTSILFIAMILPSCTLGMTQKNLTSGKAYVSSLLEKYATDIPEFNIPKATIGVKVEESFRVLSGKRKEVSVPKASFNLSVDYVSTEEKPYSVLLNASKTSLSGGVYSYDYSIGKNNDNTYTITSGESERIADPNEDFYSYFDVPYILNVLLNRNAVRFLEASLLSVKSDSSSSSSSSENKDDDEPGQQSNILTGYNINYYQNTNIWTYSIYSENTLEEETDIKFGFDDASYTRFFRYSSIEAVPASSIKFTFENDRVTKYEANYSYIDDASGNKVVGKLELNATYGEEREKTEI